MWQNIQLQIIKYSHSLNSLVGGTTQILQGCLCLYFMQSGMWIGQCVLERLLSKTNVDNSLVYLCLLKIQRRNLIKVYIITLVSNWGRGESFLLSLSINLTFCENLLFALHWNKNYNKHVFIKTETKILSYGLSF